MGVNSHISQTYQRHRPVSTSSSTTPPLTFHNEQFTLCFKSVKQANSLVGITSAYSRGLTKEMKEVRTHLKVLCFLQIIL